MGTPTQQDELFHGLTDDGGVVVINARCRLQIHSGHSVVVVAGLPIAHFATGDRLGEAHAMVTLVEQGWARQTEIARAFGRTTRTVRRYQQRFEEGGLAALGRPPGYPRGRPRLPQTRLETVEKWRGQGVAQREIARRLGVSEKAVRKLLRRLGWQPAAAEQLELGSTAADPNLSDEVGTEPVKAAADSVTSGPAPGPPRSEAPAADPNLSAPTPDPAAPHPEAGAVGAPPSEAPACTADPNLSGAAEPPLPVTLDTDPSDRRVDRVLASMGLLDDAAPIFREGKDVPCAGVLLAVPALVDSGAIEIARDVYGSIGPAFYGLRTTILTLLLMALLRIKRPEGLKEHAPAALGRLLGLDRAPEVKTLRRKLDRIAGLRRAADYGRALAQRRVESRGHALGFLYVDGHVRAYHGKREIPKTHLARMRIAMPATTDYWVNDAKGDPLFVVTTEANPGLVEMLPKIIEEARELTGDRRLTVVFDRGGWSPKLFRRLIDDNVDILTYRKGASRRVPKARFCLHEAEMDGRKLSYLLSDTNVVITYRDKRKTKRLKLRQVTRLDDKSGHQTPVLTSRRDLDTIEVAYRMFERWRQENFFKYMREEYALDALVDYGAEPANSERSVPNPARKKIVAEIKKAYAEFERVQAELGLEAMVNVETARRTMRGFKIANAGLRKRIFEVLKKITDLEKRRAKTPTRVPVRDVVQGAVVKLAVERKHLTDLLKMVGYQAEGDLLRMIAGDYRRSDDEGRTLIQTVLTTSGNIDVDDRELRVALAPLSSPHRTKLLAQLCHQLNETNTRFPGTQLVLRFLVQPEPQISPAFPGPQAPSPGHKPDIS